jgi:hypothetical protein
MAVRAISRRALLQSLPVVLMATALPWAGSTDASHIEDVSPALVEAICAHCVAFSQVRRLAREMDSGSIGLASTASIEALRSAVETECRLWIVLIGFPTSNEAERRDKTAYVLGLR